MLPFYLDDQLLIYERAGLDLVIEHTQPTVPALDKEDID